MEALARAWSVLGRIVGFTIILWRYNAESGMLQEVELFSLFSA